MYVLFIADSEEENQGNDCLYIVINDIIHTHNLIIDYTYQKLPLNRLLLHETPTEIFPLEVTAQNAIIGTFTKYVLFSFEIILFS
jgi:hypothetical protein